MFYMILFNALLALAELTIAFESRPLIMKHKSLYVSLLALLLLSIFNTYSNYIALFIDPPHTLWPKF